MAEEIKTRAMRLALWWGYHVRHYPKPPPLAQDPVTIGTCEFNHSIKDLTEAQYELTPGRWLTYQRLFGKDADAG